MSTPDPMPEDGTFEECVDELNDLVAALDRYPQWVVAFAMRTHLACLLQALLEHGVCTRPQVVEFVAELERDALQVEEN